QPAGRDVPVRRRGLPGDLPRRLARRRPPRTEICPVIVIDGVSKWYGTTQVLDRCSTTVARGEVVVVCGPSGSGKSTLIKCVNGLEPFQQGKITVDGIEVGDRKTDLPKLRARIGMVFQSFELYPHMTVLDNVCLAQVKALKRDRATA